MQKPWSDDGLDLFPWIIANNSPATLILTALGALVWLGGGNILVAYHYRRRGMSIWSGFRPFAFPFPKFNAKEWRILAVLAVISLGLMIAGTDANVP